MTWASYEQETYTADVYGQLFNDSGTKVGSEFMANTYTENTQHRDKVAALSSGGFVVTWTSSDGQDGDSDGIFGQVFMITGPTIISGLGTYTTDGGWIETFSSDYSPEAWIRVRWSAYNAANGETRIATGDARSSDQS